MHRNTDPVASPEFVDPVRLDDAEAAGPQRETCRRGARFGGRSRPARCPQLITFIFVSHESHSSVRRVVHNDDDDWDLIKGDP